MITKAKLFEFGLVASEHFDPDEMRVLAEALMEGAERCEDEAAQLRFDRRSMELAEEQEFYGGMLRDLSDALMARMPQ